MNYNVAGLTPYAINCYKLIHPFYQDHLGWHHMRFCVYSNLATRLTDFKDQRVANDFFRNYVGLCASVEDQVQQRNYLQQCLTAIQNYLKKQKSPQQIQQEDLLQFDDPLSKSEEPKRNLMEVGDLGIPHLLMDQVEVFISSEKLNSNQPQNLIFNQFQSLPLYEDPYEQQQMITMKTDLNSNDC